MSQPIVRFMHAIHWKDLTALALGLALVAFVAYDHLTVAAGQGPATEGVRPAAAAEPPGPQQIGPDAPQAAVWISCVPSNVITYATRVHVKCTTAFTGIQWFAVSASNAAYSARVLSVLTSAQVAGRTLSILYDPADLSGAAYGCSNTDCRPILGVGFGQ
jgi:hypothetical protein